MSRNVFAYVSGAHSGGSDSSWSKWLAEYLGEPVDMRTWPDVGDAAQVEVAIAWKPPSGALAALPNLKLIVSAGMGVDHLLIDPKLPRDIPIVRIVDPGLIGQMSEFAIYWTIHHHRSMSTYAAHQRAGRWHPEEDVDTVDRRIGVLGLGEIGTDTARKLAALGFTVSGWSRTQKTIDGVRCFSGAAGFDEMLGRSDVLIDVLPMTPQTANMLDSRAFSLLPKGAFFINMARGGHVVDEALLAALDSGHVAGAALDVFHVEPLPPGHPYWTHPNVHITPHVAGPTSPRTAAPSVAENIRRLRAGRPLVNLIDRAVGY
jgi:glyoxylate/hydroxypyruvate reductase A